MHIAVCDDNIADRKQLERLLKRESDKRKSSSGLLYTDSFGNSRALSQNPMQYDLFFIDMVTEEKDGLALALSLAEKGVTSPIVLCSSAIPYEEKAKELPSCPSNFLYLPKPIQTGDLTKTIDQALLLHAKKEPVIELRSETETYYVREDDILYALPSEQYVNVFLKSGETVPLLTDIYNFYDQVFMYTHMVLIGAQGLFNITFMKSYTPFSVKLLNGVTLKSNPLAVKYIKAAIRDYENEST